MKRKEVNEPDLFKLHEVKRDFILQGKILYMCDKEEKPNLNHKMRVYVKILVYKNIAPHENVYSATYSDDREKMLKINGAFECSLVLGTKVIFASLYIVSLLKDNVFLCAS